MTGETLARVMRVFNGSDGDATKALYAELIPRGPIGALALNLFRAQKCSGRAKVYRGGQPGHGSYRAMAYDRKQWSIDNVAAMLEQHGDALRLPWGWQVDDAQPYHRWVLYVELPTGQVSFHTDRRGIGPEYPGTWDGLREQSAARILLFTAQVLDSAQTSAATEAAS